MQGGHTARQLAGLWDTCCQQHACGLHTPAYSCPLEGHLPGCSPPWQSWACRAHRLLAAPAQLPLQPALTSVPCQLSPTDLQSRPRLAMSALPPTIHHKTLRAQTQLFLFALVPLLKKDSSPHPDGLNHPGSLGTPARWHQAQVPTQAQPRLRGAQPPPHSLFPALQPCLLLYQNFPHPSVHRGSPWILS